MPNVNEEQAQRAQEMLKSAVKNGAKGTGGIGAGIVLTDAIHEPDRQKQLSSEYGQRRFNLGELKENASRAVKLAYTELELVSNKYNELGRRRELKAALKHVFNLNSVDQMPDNIYEKHNLQNVITAANYEEAQVALAALDHDNSFRTMTEQQFDILKNADRFIQKVKNLRLIYKQNLEIIVDNATLEHSTKMIIENDKITLELPIRTKLANLRLPETVTGAACDCF
jgi:hypothetical protein